jgi:glycerate dehydrogenase
VPRLVVLDGYTLNPGDNPWAPLEEYGTLAVYERSARNDILPRSQGAEVLLTNKTPLDAATLAALPTLRGICVLATGVNVIDLKAATALGVPVCNIPAYSTASTAQHTIALLLELTNHVGLHDRAVHAGEWVKAPDFSFTSAPLTELEGLLLGVVGFGAIGRRVAEIALALGMRVQAAGNARKPDDPPFLERTPLDELFGSSDVITLHCPLTDQTRGLVHAGRLRQMKPSALLINASRGSLVNEAELAQALERGVIAGAAVDVLSSEPPAAGNPLLTAKNCVITPHHAWATLAARRRAMRITADNVAAILNRAPRNVVNPAAIPASRG